MGNYFQSDVNANLTPIHTVSQLSMQQVADPSKEVNQLVRVIVPTYEDDKVITALINEILRQSDGKFVDKSFQWQKENQLMDQLFPSLTRSKMSLYDDTNTNIVEQQELRLSYLSAVQWAIGRHPALKHKMAETSRINDVGMYCFNMYPNGRPEKVIVDSYLPVKRGQNIIYSRPNGTELWPLLMEKAWCKLIGGYTKAFSLNCEDAFEEITGAPACTYALDPTSSFPTTFPTFLGGRKGSNKVSEDQVCYIQGYFQGKYTICSPYTTFNFPQGQRLKPYRVVLPQESIARNFDHMVVGYSFPSYAPHYMEVKCDPQQSVVYKIVIGKKEQVGVRFSQYYAGYASENPNYKYSPVMMELFQEKEEDNAVQYRVVEDAMGGKNSMGKHKSVHAHKGVVGQMLGTYYLRLSVQWRHPDVRTGKIVVYATEGNAVIVPVDNPMAKLEEIFTNIATHSNFQAQCYQNLSSLGVQLKLVELKDYSVLAVINSTNKTHTIYVAIKEASKESLAKAKDANNLQVNKYPYTKAIQIKFEINKSKIALLFLQPLDYTKDYSMGRYIVTNTRQ